MGLVGVVDEEGVAGGCLPDEGVTLVTLGDGRVKLLAPQSVNDVVRYDACTRQKYVMLALCLIAPHLFHDWSVCVQISI
jgi:hypothetical protein